MCPFANGRYAVPSLFILEFKSHLQEQFWFYLKTSTALPLKIYHLSEMYRDSVKLLSFVVKSTLCRIFIT